MAAPRKKSPAQIEAIIKSVEASGARIHTSTVRRVRASAETHIFRVRSYYDRATKNNAGIDSVLIGKLPKGVTDLAQMISTDKKYAPGKASSTRAKAEKARAQEPEAGQEKSAAELKRALDEALAANKRLQAANDELREQLAKVRQEVAAAGAALASMKKLAARH